MTQDAEYVPLINDDDENDGGDVRECEVEVEIVKNETGAEAEVDALAKTTQRKSRRRTKLIVSAFAWLSLCLSLISLFASLYSFSSSLSFSLSSSNSDYYSHYAASDSGRENASNKNKKGSSRIDGGSGMGRIEREDLDKLQHPSLYLGLDRVPSIKQRLEVEKIIAAASGTMPAGSASNSHEHGHQTGHNGEGQVNSTKLNNSTDVVVLPFDITRISQLYPHTAFSSGEDKEWVFVSKSDSAILSFHVPALEDLSTSSNGLSSASQNESRECVFSGRFPAREGLQGKLLTLEGGRPKGSAILGVWEIEPKSNNRPQSITWSNKPHRQRVLGHVTAEFGGEEGGDMHSMRSRNRKERQVEDEKREVRFGCTLGSDVLVELACVDTGEGQDRDGDVNTNGGVCRVEYRGRDASPDFGFTITVG